MTARQRFFLKLGGLLSGIAALITALATLIGTLYPIFSPTTDVPAAGADRQMLDPSGGPRASDRQRAESMRVAASSPPGAGQQVLAVWPGDDCVYRATVQEIEPTQYHVVFGFADATWVPSTSVYVISDVDPEDITLGTTVYATDDSMTGRWIAGIVLDKQGEKFYVERDADHPCTSKIHHVWTTAENVVLR